MFNICTVDATQLQLIITAKIEAFMSKVVATAAAAVLGSLLLTAPTCGAGERPYFVTYDQTMEEPGNLEIEAKGLTASPQDGNSFLSGVTEFEYGAKGWWTTEFYLAGQTTSNESTIFTGYRWENRFRLLMHEHIVNPVLYLEYEDLNGADKSLLEVVGFASQFDAQIPNAEASRERKREIEARLILSSNVNGWNISENFIAEKNLAGDPWEVQNGVDDVLVHQQTEAIFPAISGENGAFVGRGLAGQVELGGPPAFGAVFEFSHPRQETVAVLRRGRQPFGLNFKIARLFHRLIVGDEVRSFTGAACGRRQE